MFQISSYFIGFPFVDGLLQLNFNPHMQDELFHVLMSQNLRRSLLLQSTIQQTTQLFQILLKMEVLQRKWMTILQTTLICGLLILEILTQV